MMDHPVLRLIAPPTIWFLHFGISYGSLSLLCNAGASGAHVYVVAGATLVAVSALVALAMTRPRGASRFLDLGGVALSFLSSLAVAWTALAAFVVPVC